MRSSGVMGYSASCGVRLCRGKIGAVGHEGFWMVGRSVSAPLLTLACILAVVPAAADNWFIQTDAGVTRLKLDRVEDNDPVGVVFTANRTDGTGIIPRSVRQPNL